MSTRRPYVPGLIQTEFSAQQLQYELERVADEFTVANGYWEDYTASLTAAQPGLTNPPNFAAFRNGLVLPAFDDTQAEDMYIQIHIKHDIKLGTLVYPHIHWSPGNSTGTGTVRWGFEYSVAKGHQQQAFPATTTVYVEQAAVGTAYMHMIGETSETDAIPSTNIEPDSMVLFRIFRDAAHANDTFTGDAFGIQVDLHYQREFVGTPNRSPDFYL